MPKEEFGDWLRAMHTMAEEAADAENYVRQIDVARYAPAELQQTRDGSRMVRLCEEPMHMNEVLPWLLEQGLVKRIMAICTDPECSHEHCDGYVHTGWGTTYFASPFDKTEPR